MVSSDDILNGMSNAADSPLSVRAAQRWSKSLSLSMRRTWFARVIFFISHFTNFFYSTNLEFVQSYTKSEPKTGTVMGANISAPLRVSAFYQELTRYLEAMTAWIFHFEQYERENGSMSPNCNVAFTVRTGDPHHQRNNCTPGSPCHYSS